MLVRDFDIKKDYIDIKSLIKEFENETLNNLGIVIDEQAIHETILASKDNALVLEKEGKIVGVFAGNVVTLRGENNSVFQETIWFVSKKHRKYGIKLLKEAEARCKKLGINKMVMVAIANEQVDKLEKFYVRMGFKPLERHYLKEL